MPENQDSLKQAAAESALLLVESGMLVGLGSGSTVAFALAGLGRRIREGLRITAIPTSEDTAAQARDLGITLADWSENTQIDLTIDGADEIETVSLNLIKGHGGALLREKIVASASQRLLIIADQSKLVEHLGQLTTIPIEVVPFGWRRTARRLRDLEGTAVLRTLTNGQPYITDNGHYILDGAFPDRIYSEALARDLDGIVGVIEHGLFLGMTSEVRLGTPVGVRRLVAGYGPVEC